MFVSQRVDICSSDSLGLTHVPFFLVRNVVRNGWVAGGCWDCEELLYGDGSPIQKKPNIKIDQNSRSIDVKNPLKIVSIDIDIIDPEPNLDHSPIPYKKNQ